MKRAVEILILLVTIVIMAGCVGENAPTQSAISFSIYNSRVPNLKSVQGKLPEQTQRQSSKPEKFLVNAFLDQGQEPDFMYNQLVELSSRGIGDNSAIGASSALASYIYTPIKYWPADPDRKVKFFAYWLGFGSEKHNGTVNGTGNGSGNGELPRKFSLNSKTGVYTAEIKGVEGKTDMLYSEDVVANNQIAKVKFKMRHLLSSVIINVEASETLPEDIKISISGVKTSGIYPDGRLTLSPILSPTSQHDYKVEWEPGGTPLKDVFVDKVHNLILIPQKTEGIILKVEYSFQQKNSLGEWVKYKAQELSIDLSKAVGIRTWQNNKQYTYTLRISPNKIEFDDIKVENWSTGTVEQPIE